MRKGKCNSLNNLFMAAYYVSVVMRAPGLWSHLFRWVGCKSMKPVPWLGNMLPYALVDTTIQRDLCMGAQVMRKLHTWFVP